jgi:hypothetical protein
LHQESLEQRKTTTRKSMKLTTEKESRPHNSTYPKGGVSCSKDSFVVSGSLVFQMKFCGKNPALRVAAKRCASFYGDRATAN